jgi:sigma-E factor negative regulatory protein RseA
MLERTAEQISMLLDDELHKDEVQAVIQRMRDDKDLKDCWEHYHVIGDTLRKSLPPVICTDLAKRIADAIHYEPAYLHPTPRVSPAEQGHRANNAVGFALAASISAISVFGLLQIGHQNDAAPQLAVASSTPSLPLTTAAASVVRAPSTPGIMFASVEDASTPLPMMRATHDVPAADDVAANLSDYLVNYHKYGVATREQSDMFSYISMVSYDR